MVPNAHPVNSFIGGPVLCRPNQTASTELPATSLPTLFEQYKGSHHVRRVATWIGFLLVAIDRASDGNFKINRERQIVFTYGQHKFKARFEHKLGPRGGIEFVKALPSRGTPDGLVAATVTTLGEAENVYRDLEAMLDAVL